MTPELVTVILCTNRRSPYLAETLASLRAQTWTDWELVLVDDGSPVPDELDAAVAELPYARVLHRPASGLAMSRNAGIAAARGGLVAFVDDDDVWHPERLARQVLALRADADAVASHSGGWLMDAAGVELPGGWPPVTASREDLLSGRVDIPRIVTLMVRWETLVTLGGFTVAFELAEDDEFILRLLRHGRSVGVDERLVGYRQHPGQVTGADLDRRQRWSRRAIALQLWAARWSAQGRRQAADLVLLQENLARYRRRVAAASLSEAVGSLHRYELAGAGRRLGRAVRWSPGQVASLGVRRARRLATSRRSA